MPSTCMPSGSSGGGGGVKTLECYEVKTTHRAPNRPKGAQTPSRDRTRQYLSNN